MAYSPKTNEDKMLKVLNAWKTLAPKKVFAGKTVEEYEAQVDKSLAPRQRLLTMKDEETMEITTREVEDVMTLSEIEVVVAGVIADPTEGSDSALYEAMGYIRKSARKSGLTRKKKTTPSED